MIQFLHTNIFYIKVPNKILKGRCYLLVERIFIKLLRIKLYSFFGSFIDIKQSG